MSVPRAKPVIRPFRVADQVVVRQLVLDGLSDHFQQIDESLNPDLEDIHTHYTRKGHVFVVAEFASRIIGAGGLIALRYRAGRIVRVSVSKECRRQGVARDIVSSLIEQARNRNYERLVVETNHDWSAAIELYRGCGFTIYAQDSGCVHMQLVLRT